MVDSFGTPEGVFKASLQDYQSIKGLNKPIPTYLEEYKKSLDKFYTMAEKQMDSAYQVSGRIIKLTDPDYPEWLRNHPTVAPPMLHVRGNLDALNIVKRIAIVGTREPSTAIINRTESTAEKLGRAGYLVVSGMAKGIDASAHRGALRGNGKTVAVLGCGVDKAYPPENKKLMENILEDGAVVSEFPFGTSPNPDNLRKRNKLIVGISQGVIVAECPINSGAMIAARNATELNKPIMVFSHNMETSSNYGTRLLAEYEFAKELITDSWEEIEKITTSFIPEPDRKKRFEKIFKYKREGENNKTDKVNTRKQQNRNIGKQLSLDYEENNVEQQEPKRVSETEKLVKHPKFGTGRLLSIRDGSYGKIAQVIFGKKEKKEILLSTLEILD